MLWCKDLDFGVDRYVVGASMSRAKIMNVKIISNTYIPTTATLKVRPFFTFTTLTQFQNEKLSDQVLFLDSD